MSVHNDSSSDVSSIIPPEEECGEYFLEFLSVSSIYLVFCVNNASTRWVKDVHSVIFLSGFSDLLKADTQTSTSRNMLIKYCRQRHNL